MKLFTKKLYVYIAALVLTASVGIGIASTHTNKTVRAGEKWYEFTNDLGDDDADNPSNYTITPNDGQNAPSCPTGEDERCAVLAQPGTDNDHPDLSSGSVIETRTRAAQ